VQFVRPYLGVVTVYGSLEPVPYAWLIVLAGAVGLVTLVVNALMVGLARRPTGWLLVAAGTVMVAVAMFGSLFATWLAAATP